MTEPVKISFGGGTLGNTVSQAKNFDAKLSPAGDIKVSPEAKINFSRPVVTSTPAPVKAPEPVASPVEQEAPVEEPVEEPANEIAVPVPASSDSPQATADQGVRENIVKVASEHVGASYVWGGTSPTSGWDCSGYVQYVFKQAGIELPRVKQWVGKEKISQKDARPGDIVVQYNGGHVGIYAGNGMMYSALNPSDRTQFHPTTWTASEFYKMG